MDNTSEKPESAQTDVEFIQFSLLRAVKQRLEEMIDEESSAACARVLARINNAVDSLALSILSNYSIEKEGLEIVIRVKK